MSAGKVRKSMLQPVLPRRIFQPVAPWFRPPSDYYAWLACWVSPIAGRSNPRIPLSKSLAMAQPYSRMRDTIAVKIDLPPNCNFSCSRVVYFADDFSPFISFWQCRQRIGHTKTVLLPPFFERPFFFAIGDSRLEHDLLWQANFKHTSISIIPSSSFDILPSKSCFLWR
jgi:hypothetical protein